MIWTMIGIGILLFGIAGTITYNKWCRAPEWLDTTGFTLTLIGTITTTFLLAVVICNLAFSDIGYEDMSAERQMLEYRIEHCENTIGNELLYSDVFEFNEKLRHSKKWRNCPWTNWFYNRKIAEMDYIDIMKGR